MKFYDTFYSKGEAKEIARVYVTDYGWPEIRYGKLKKWDGKEVWAIELKSRISPNGKEVQLARAYVGSTFELVGVVE